MPQFRIEREGATDYVSVSPAAAEAIAGGLRAAGGDRVAARLEKVASAGGHGNPVRLHDDEAALVLIVLDELVSTRVALASDVEHLRRALRLSADVAAATRRRALARNRRGRR